MNNFTELITTVNNFIWGPPMLVFLIGTGFFLTIKTRFLTWKNLGYAIKITFSKESRTKSSKKGDVSPFSSLTTALASTIGTGNIVGVATAMISGGPGALLWMWISALFGLTTKFSECMLATKYRGLNSSGEISGGPMYTIKKAFKNKKIGNISSWLFAFFAVIASFGIGNMTQANSISSSLKETFNLKPFYIGIFLMILTLVIILGGIQSISKTTTFIVPFMAIFYIFAGIIVIIGNINNLPSGIYQIFITAFSFDAMTGGVLGSIVASMSKAMRYGISRGCFSNEAGMGSAAITAAAATTDNPVKQGYINMTGTFWDTIVICTITGFALASSGVIGTTHTKNIGTYNSDYSNLSTKIQKSDSIHTTNYNLTYNTTTNTLTLTDNTSSITLTPFPSNAYYKLENVPTDCAASFLNGKILGIWTDGLGNAYIFNTDGTFIYEEAYTGSALTIQAFKTIWGDFGAGFITISIALFAFSTILGWEYQGEKAFEYLFNSNKYVFIYRLIFSVFVFIGTVSSLNLVWNLSDIANALMIIPNLLCLLILNKEIAYDIKEYEPTKNK